MNFTWEALHAAQNALQELRVSASMSQRVNESRTMLSEEKLEKIDAYRQKFDDALSNDLNMPQALAVAWEVVKSNIPGQDKYDLLVDFDEVLGLGLAKESKVSAKGGSAYGRKSQKSKVSKEIKLLMEKREALRKEQKFEEADAVRKAIEAKGYALEDTPEGVRIRPNYENPAQRAVSVPLSGTDEPLARNSNGCRSESAPGDVEA